MDLEIVKRVVGDLPWMSHAQARQIRARAREFGLTRVLELGFMHGVSTCYLAAIAEELDGSVTSCDLPSSGDLEPAAEQLLERCGLRGRVQLHRDAEGAEWRMMTLIEEGRVFDFVYIDAAHAWHVAGFQFFLAEKLLRAGGWILFDDLDYTLVEQAHAGQPWAMRQTRAQRETPQVRKVWELLVKPHPRFGNFTEHDSWAWCQKLPDT